MIHRLVSEAFIPNPENKPEVNHKDNNPLNNHVANLEWMTRSENMKHVMQFIPREQVLRHVAFMNTLRSKRTWSKLNAEQVMEIRSKYIPNKYSLNRLAAEYNVSKKLILLVVQRKVWCDVM